MTTAAYRRRRRSAPGPTPTGYGTRPELAQRPRTTLDHTRAVRRQPRRHRTVRGARVRATYDRDNGYVSDDERDEDADGLTNYDEDTGRCSPGWWAACYTDEAPFPIRFAGTGRSTPTPTATASSTAPTTRTSTTSRTSWSSAAAGRRRAPGRLRRRDRRGRQRSDRRPTFWVNPFNPCLPGPRLADLPAPSDDGRGLPAVQRRTGSRTSSTSRSDVTFEGPHGAGPRSF